MHPDVEALLKLQHKDEAVMGVDQELAALEPELHQLDDELAAAEAELEAIRNRVAEADSRRAELEGKIESYRVMQERRRQRLEWVRGAKEASTLMAELDLARTVLAKEEAEWLRSADKVQEIARLATEAEQKVEALRVEQAPRREQIAARHGELVERLEAAKVERGAAAQAVPAELRERYARIMQGRTRLALYALRNGACGHCFTAVPLNRQQKLRVGGGVENCEACGVLLYHEAR